MGPIGYPETSVTTNLRYVTQKSKSLIPTRSLRIKKIMDKNYTTWRRCEMITSDNQRVVNLHLSSQVVSFKIFTAGWLLVSSRKSMPLKMKAARFFSNSGTDYLVTRRHITEKRNNQGIY